MITLSAGKYRGLKTLADANGIFKMLAADQRTPLITALANHQNSTPEEVGYAALASIKKLLAKVLAPEASAVLIDPVWGHPNVLEHVPGRVGLLSTLESHTFELKDGERYSGTIEGWSIKKIKRSGCNGVKLLVWHRPDVSAENQAHQDALIRAVGDECRLRDIPFVLELLLYPFSGETVDTPVYAKRKPQRVLESVRHYANDSFGVDLLKLEFPADLKYTREFAGGAFDGSARELVYDLSEVQGYLAELNDITNVPWVLLSAGVGPREFALAVELACGAGASGFLAGRAVWLDALEPYPNLDAVERRLQKKSLPYLRQISALADRAAPWRQHARYGGEIELYGAGETWAQDYGA